MVKQTVPLGVLEAVLGSRTKVAVTRLLCGYRKAFSGREIARRVKHNAAHVHKVLRELVSAGLVEAERVGRVRLFRLAEDNPWVRGVLTPLFEAEAQTERKLWEEVAQAVGPGLVSLVLFGSRARGKARAGSDVDILAVLRQAAEVERVRVDILEAGLRYGLSIEALCVPLERFGRWAQENSGLWQRILDEGVVVAGKDVQELEQNVGKELPSPG